MNHEREVQGAAAARWICGNVDTKMFYQEFGKNINIKIENKKCNKQSDRIDCRSICNC